MAIQHAPYALFGDLVLSYGKTTKTACGKRIRTDRLVTRDATTCPDCRRVIAGDRAKMAEARAIAEDMLRTHGCPDCGAPFDNLAAWNNHRVAQHKLNKHRPATCW